MSCLSTEARTEIIRALCEGVSIRSVERLTGHHRDTVMRLGVEIGNKCQALHEKLMVDLRISRLEFDEIWSFVKKKRRNVAENDPDTVGDQYIFIAMDSISKAIVSWRIGKRNAMTTMQFVTDVRRRVLGSPEISTDGYHPYTRAVDEVFDGAASHGIVDKKIVILAKDADHGKYYAKESLVKIERTAMSGSPSKISTSYIERQNLTLRQTQRRMTRLTNGFSKKYENHCAAIALYAAHYNLCRVHQTLRVTPAMHLGITDHVWSIPELTETSPRATAAGRAWRVIDGGVQ